MVCNLPSFTSLHRLLFGMVSEVFFCCLCAGWRVGVPVLSAASADQLHQRFWEHQTGSWPLPEQPAGPVLHPAEASMSSPHPLHLTAEAGSCLSRLNESVCTQVFHCLNEILELCQNFCSLVSQSTASLDERGTAQLDLLVKVELLVRSPTSEKMSIFICYCTFLISGLQTSVFIAV